MISYDDVMAKINAIKTRLMKARERIPKLEEKIFDLSKKFTDAVLDEASDEKLSEIKDELTIAQKEIDVLQSVDFEKKVYDNLKSNETLAKLVSDFIKQEEDTLEKMTQKDNELRDTIIECYSALIEAVKAEYVHRQDMVERVGRIDDIESAMGAPVRRGLRYAAYQGRMKLINHERLFNSIRIANGNMPQY